MSDPFLAEIRSFPFGFAPKGWAQCNGQLLPINQNQALFSLLGTVYGGNGQTNFALPDLRGRTPIHRGDTLQQGQAGVAETHTLTAAQMPIHRHTLNAGSDTANTHVPALALPSGRPRGGAALFSAGGAADTTMHSTSLASAGGGQAHENMQPFKVLNICIALQGIFPSRN